MMVVAGRTPAAMSAIPMAMGLCWRKVSLWEIDVEVLLGSWQASPQSGQSRDAWSS